MPAFFSWWFVVYHLQKHLPQVSHEGPIDFWPFLVYGDIWIYRGAFSRRQKGQKPLPSFTIHLRIWSLQVQAGKRFCSIGEKFSLHNNRVVHPVQVLSLVVEHESWGFHSVTKCPTIKIPRTRNSQWISCFVTFPSLVIQLIVTQKRKALIGRSHFHKIAFYPPKQCCFSFESSKKDHEKPTKWRQRPGRTERNTSTLAILVCFCWFRNVGGHGEIFVHRESPFLKQQRLGPESTSNFWGPPGKDGPSVFFFGDIVFEVHIIKFTAFDFDFEQWLLLISPLVVVVTCRCCYAGHEILLLWGNWFL